jgi:hypothetical protein
MATVAHTAYNAVIGSVTIDTTDDSTDTTADIDKVITYQNELAKENAVKQTSLDEINSNLNYTVMAITIWVPLGILAGYYLYKKNAGVPQPA